ncbi:MAG: thermonuclease family protein [Rhodospirillales bacterium]|nr:thermonuclease family protein [Rhodospirillales bacterium]
MSPRTFSASFFPALVLIAGPALAADYAWPVARVIDGDTVAVDASADLPPELADLRVRLRGVDTPEKGGRAKCAHERDAGQAATAFTTRAVNKASTIVVRDPEWGKWGGRVVADLVLDNRSLSAALIATGHGRAYDGGRRGSWCQ